MQNQQVVIFKQRLPGVLGWVNFQSLHYKYRTFSSCRPIGGPEENCVFLHKKILLCAALVLLLFLPDQSHNLHLPLHPFPACAHHGTCRWPSSPASSPRTARWPTGPSGALVPKPAWTPSLPEATALGADRCSSSLWARGRSARRWRSRSRVNLRVKAHRLAPRE